MKKDPLGGAKCDGVGKEGVRLLKKSISKIEKAMNVKLKAARLAPIDSRDIKEESSKIILEELPTFERRLRAPKSIKQRGKSEILPYSGDLRILFLAANPISTDRLQLDEEVRLISERIKKGSHRDVIDFQTRWAVRVEDIFDSLNDLRPKIVHFSGHGGAAGSANEGIMLVDEGGGVRPLDGRQLLNLFSPFSVDMQAVVLNCCHSELQADALSKIINFTIGIGGDMQDDPARIFSGQLYSALAHGRDLKDAFAQALARLKIDGGACNLPRLIEKPGLRENAGAFIRAPEEMDYSSFISRLNSLSGDFFRDRTHKIKNILSAARRLTDDQSLSAQVAVQALDLVKAERAATEAFKDGLQELRGRWAQHLHEICVARMAEVCDSCDDILLADKGVVDFAKQVFDTFLTNPRIAAELAATLRGGLESYARARVGSVGLISMRYDRLIEYLPETARHRVIRRIWEFS